MAIAECNCRVCNLTQSAVDYFVLLGSSLLAVRFIFVTQNILNEHISLILFFKSGKFVSYIWLS